MNFLVAISFGLLAVIVHQANGLCNSCSAITGLACVSNNQFKVCENGVPQGTAITCPSGTFCTPNERVCDPSATSAQSCTKCKVCDDSKLFACTKYNAFSLCTGTDNYDTTREYICPDGLVCSIDSPSICVNGQETGIGGTCPFDSTGTTETPEPAETTTPNAQEHPNEFCANKGFPGSYEVAADTTCKEFIRCTLSGTTWIGSLYVCPKENYFNPNSQMCGRDPPSRCSAAASP